MSEIPGILLVMRNKEKSRSNKRKTPSHIRMGTLIHSSGLRDLILEIDLFYKHNQASS